MKKEKNKSEKLAITAVGQYDGHTVKKNKAIDLKFKFSYDERSNMATAIAFINQNINVVVKVENNKPVKIGMFDMHELKFDKDGQCFVKLSSTIDYIETDNLNEIITINNLIKIRMQAEIILEEEESYE